MAYNNLNFSKLTANIRLLRYLIDKRISVKFSTSQINHEQTSAPVKYTANKAAQIPIAEIIGLENEKKNPRLWYERYVLGASVFTLLVYFCIIREENDIDEMLKGNPNYIDPRVKLVQLKTQLKYCEANNLPTAALKAKIDEIEEPLKKFTPVFSK